MNSLNFIKEADILFDNKKFEDAYKLYTLSLKGCDSIDIRIQIGWMMYLGLGTSKTLISDVHSFIVKGYYSAEHCYALGRMEEKNENIREALCWYSRSIKLGGKKSFYRMGCILDNKVINGYEMSEYYFHKGSRLGMHACSSKVLLNMKRKGGLVGVWAKALILLGKFIIFIKIFTTTDWEEFSDTYSEEYIYDRPLFFKIPRHL